MTDYVIRATAAAGQVRAFACTTRGVAEEGRKVHNNFPICTAALGRLMSGALMMAADMKGERDLITLSIKSDGPIRGITVTADAQGHVKGYCANPRVILPSNASGHLNVGGAVGRGTLNVIKDIGLKDPYVGQIELRTGEIAEDLTAYFAVSEQIPSSVGLGVLLDRENNTVRQSGGFIIQLMPDASEETISFLEQKLQGIRSVTSMLDENMTPEDILKDILGELHLEINDRKEVSFYCGCSRERVEKALVSLGRDELSSMIADNKTEEVNCDFCGRHYYFSNAELKELYSRAKA